MARMRIDRMLRETLDGPAKLEALLRASGHNFRTLAKQYALYPQHVRNTLDGERRGEEVREALASELGLTRAEVDRLIDKLRRSDPTGMPA